MSAFFHDLGHAWRVHLRYRGQTLLAIAVIAIASGFAFASFSLYGALTLASPQGLSAPQSLASVYRAKQGGISHRLSEYLLERAGTVSGHSSVQYEEGVDLRLPEQQVAATVAQIGPGFFELLGVDMAEGRAPDPSDHESNASITAVISHAFWNDYFDGDPAVIGREYELADTPFRIVGVAEAGFTGFFREQSSDLWIPRTPYATQILQLPDQVIDLTPLRPILRVADGVSLRALEQDLAEVSEAAPGILRQELGSEPLGVDGRFALNPTRSENAETQLTLFLILSALMVLVAAANISLFFLARAPERQREMAIRLAHGATLPRLMRQLFTESAALVVVAAALGLLLGLWLQLGLSRLVAMPEVVDQPQATGPLLGFITIMVLALVTVVSIAPIYDLRRRTLVDQTRSGAARIGFSQRLLAAAQILLAGLILSLALHFGHTFIQLHAAGPGYELDNIQILEIQPQPTDRFRPDIQAIPGLQADIRRILTDQLGAEAVGFTGQVPVGSRPGRQQFKLEEGLRESVDADALMGSPDWLAVLQIPKLRGQLPEPGDEYAAVVNRRFAERAWGDIDVVGQWLHPPARFGGGDEPFNVAAVMEDFHFQHPADELRPVVVVNRNNMMAFLDDLVIRGAIDRAEAIAKIKPLLDDFSPPLMVVEDYELAAAYRTLMAPDRARASMASTSAALVVLLAVVGFLSTLRFMVARARFEFAIRAAVGRAPRALRRDVIRRAFGLALPGMLISIPAALLTLAWLQDRMEGSHWPAGISTLLAVTLLLALLLLAADAPARQVARMNPADALREE